VAGQRQAGRLGQPVTPPIFIRSGMARSQAPASMAWAMSQVNHQFSPVWMGTGEARRTRAWPARSSAATGSSTQVRSQPASRWIRRIAPAALCDWFRSTISRTSGPITSRTPATISASSVSAPSPILILMARKPASTDASSSSRSLTGSTTPKLS
jgi:hypothetical protein